MLTAGRRQRGRRPPQRPPAFPAGGRSGPEGRRIAGTPAIPRPSSVASGRPAVCPKPAKGACEAAVDRRIVGQIARAAPFGGVETHSRLRVDRSVRGKLRADGTEFFSARPRGERARGDTAGLPLWWSWSAGTTSGTSCRKSRGLCGGEAASPKKQSAKSERMESGAAYASQQSALLAAEPGRCEQRARPCKKRERPALRENAAAGAEARELGGPRQPAAAAAKKTEQLTVPIEQRVRLGPDAMGATDAAEALFVERDRMRDSRDRASDAR